jgi:hypothetical protein
MKAIKGERVVRYTCTLSNEDFATGFVLFSFGLASLFFIRASFVGGFP